MIDANQVTGWAMLSHIFFKNFDRIPPKVEYSLTPKAQTLLPVLEQLCDWGLKNQKN